MASTVTVSASARVDDGSAPQVNAVSNPASFPVGVGANGQRQTISLTGSNTFTALTVPTGVKGIFVPNLPASLVLKSVTGDGAGLTLTGASTNSLPLLLPLNGTPTLGFLNTGSTVTVDIMWF